MSEKIKTAVMEVIKAHMDGENKNTKAVLSDVMQSVNEILEQQPCDDAISREAVYSILNEYHIGEDEIESAMDECQNLTVNGIISDVSLLPSVTQKSGKWIPVSERLPKPFEHCLITTTDGEVIYHYDDGHYSKYKAWMPLPKPYEPQEGANE